MTLKENELRVLSQLYVYMSRWVYMVGYMSMHLRIIANVHNKLRNINLLNVTSSLIFRNPREWMFLI